MADAPEGWDPSVLPLPRRVEILRREGMVQSRRGLSRVNNSEMPRCTTPVPPRRIGRHKKSTPFRLCKSDTTNDPQAVCTSRSSRFPTLIGVEYFNPVTGKCRDGTERQKMGSTNDSVCDKKLYRNLHVHWADLKRCREEAECIISRACEQFRELKGHYRKWKERLSCEQPSRLPRPVYKMAPTKQKGDAQVTFSCGLAKAKFSPSAGDASKKSSPIRLPSVSPSPQPKCNTLKNNRLSKHCSIDRSNSFPSIYSPNDTARRKLS